MASGIKVFAPASVGNMACGFDILGMALSQPGDEIILRKTHSGLSIKAIHGDSAETIPLSIEKNTAGMAVKSLLEGLGRTTEGIEMEIFKKISVGSGLGLSAASAAAAVWGVNALLNLGLTKLELLPHAAAGEFTASGSNQLDNVAPSLLGGIILSSNNSTFDVHRLPVPQGLHVTIIKPAVQIFTRDSRKKLDTHLLLKDHVIQSGNLGGLIIGLYRSDLDLISRSLNDVIIEPQRASSIPYFYEIKQAAMESGALGCSISGSGPSIFALCSDSHTAETCAEQMQTIYNRNKISSRIFISKINQEGAQLL